MSLPDTMSAVLLTGHGGFDKLEFRQNVPVPKPKAGEVLIKVAAAGVNHTDINTRIGWYSKAISASTNAGGSIGFKALETQDASWSGTPLQFPRIQGADVCGYIAAIGQGVDQNRLGQRVIVRNMLRSYVNYRPFECWTLGSECDGGFAQFAIAPACESYAITCQWTDAELAAVPCAFSTAENMLERADVGAERIIITGASGGVGSAAVQLAKRRGAEVIAIASPSKAKKVREIGADHIFDRGADLKESLGENSVDVVLDLVAGDRWSDLLAVLRRGGKYVTAGAIGGPVVTLDLRDLYLKDLTLIGTTFQEDLVFSNLVSYIEAGELQPTLAKTYPLEDIKRAQQDFIDKKYFGNLVLIPQQEVNHENRSGTRL